MTEENRLQNAHAEIAKAFAALGAARALGDLGLFDDASSRLYYAIFHLVSAALLMVGVQAETHGGVAALLGQHLVRPGLVPVAVARDFSTLMALRQQSDYNRHFVCDANGFADDLARAEVTFRVLAGFLASRGASVPGQG
ncbi:MAG: HEPN domain-containing protein [Polyangiaceae bacterium]|nr:HEPN domain-containing protein [Polyangiaceae bacterium]